LAITTLLLAIVASPAHAGGGKDKEQPSGATIIRARFQKPLDKLREALQSSTDPNVVVQNLRAGNLRGTTFALEGMLKFYEKRYTNLAGFRPILKRLEDQLGWYLDSEDHLEWARKLGLTPETDPDVFKYLNQDRELNHQKLVDLLKNDHWIPDSQHAQGSTPQAIDLNLTMTKWDSLEDDHELVVRRLQHYVDKELLEAQYDMKDLENGLHKFRREIRWLLIYMQTLNGQVVLDDRELGKKWQEILKDPVAKSPFSKLPAPEAQDYHTFFPRAFYLELTKAVKELGDAKDSGEALADDKWLVQALLYRDKDSKGPARTLAEARDKAAELARNFPNFVSPVDTAEPIRLRIQGGKMLRHLSEMLHDQRDWSKKDCREFFRKWVKKLAA